jgi:hypothetical protein
MASGGPDWGRISAIFGIVASLGGVAGFLFSHDTQRCLGLGGAYRGDPLGALRHCSDESMLGTTTPGAVDPAASSGSTLARDADAGDPRQMAGTHWVFYDGGAKTYATFNPDGTVTFSDPAYGAGGVWELAGTRGVAFHTDAYEFGGTVGRGVPDSFEVTYRRLPQGSVQSPQRTATFTRVGSL